jgi:hypothetical protein
VEASQRQRLAVSREVMKALRHRDFRNALDLTDANGEHTVVVALPSDPMRRIFKQLKRVSGVAYIGVTDAEGDIEFIAVGPPESVAPDDKSGASDECPIHGDASVGLLLAYLREHRRPLRFREADPDVTVQLVDDLGPYPSLTQGA